MTDTKIFLGGATGYTGRYFVDLCGDTGRRLVSWMRRASASVEPVYGAVMRADPAEIAVLGEGMQACGSVVSLIGTTRAQFDDQTSYETVDIGTTRSLVQAAQQAGTNPRFVLLSSVGAGWPAGAYLKAKQKAEQIVRGSGLPYVIVRPSFILGPGRKLALPSRMLPAMVPPFSSYRGIYASELARILYFAATAPESSFDDLGLIWEGDLIWKALARSTTG